MALIMVDYPNRRRLKIYAHLEVRDLDGHPGLAEALAQPDYRGRPERVMVLHVDAFDWNCPQHITPRYSGAEIASALAPLNARLDSLEAENAMLRAQLVLSESTVAPSERGGVPSS